MRVRLSKLSAYTGRPLAWFLDNKTLFILKLIKAIILYGFGIQDNNQDIDITNKEIVLIVKEIKGQYVCYHILEHPYWAYVRYIRSRLIWIDGKQKTILI